jgi:hypothetical protein
MGAEKTAAFAESWNAMALQALQANPTTRQVGRAAFHRAKPPQTQKPIPKERGEACGNHENEQQPATQAQSGAQMATRTIKMPNGTELTLSSNELEAGDLVVAEILLEMAAEQGSPTLRFDLDELARRLIAKGYDPATGNPLR